MVGSYFSSRSITAAQHGLQLTRFASLRVRVKLALGVTRDQDGLEQIERRAGG
jgi:hypothetical protein